MGNKISLFKGIVSTHQKYFKGPFGIRLFYWNWKLFAESTVNKGKN